MKSRLVVVGASLAGLRAVEAARKVGFEGAITLIGAEDHLPYDRPPLSKEFLSTDVAVDPLYRQPDQLAELDVDLLLGTRATGLDTDARAVQLGDRAVDYDALVIATGASARTLPGTANLEGVHTLRTLDDARAVRASLDAGARTVVVGAGFIGSEVASAARKRGLDVTIVEAAPTPLVRAVGDVLGAECSALHRNNGVDLRCGVSVTAIEGSGSVERVRLSDGRIIPADLVVVGVGASPATGWLEGSGLALDDGIVCDANLAASAAGVYAAGDVARWHNPLFDKSVRLEHWTSAAEQGARAARNAVDPANAQPYSTVPYFWSDWYQSRIQFVGVPHAVDLEVIGSADDRLIALYGDGERLVGALTVNRQPDIMKFRALIAKRARWDEAVSFANERAKAWAPSLQAS